MIFFLIIFRLISRSCLAVRFSAFLIMRIKSSLESSSLSPTRSRGVTLRSSWRPLAWRPCWETRPLPSTHKTRDTRWVLIRNKIDLKLIYTIPLFFLGSCGACLSPPLLRQEVTDHCRRDGRHVVWYGGGEDHSRPRP